MNNTELREKQRKETEKLNKEAHELYDEIMNLGSEWLIMILSDFINETEFTELIDDGVIVCCCCKAHEYKSKES